MCKGYKQKIKLQRKLSEKERTVKQNNTKAKPVTK